MLRNSKSTLFANPIDINQVLDQLSTADFRQLYEGKYDQDIERCILHAESTCNRELLEKLAFILFSERRSVTHCGYDTLVRKQQRALKKK